MLTQTQSNSIRSFLSTLASHRTLIFAWTIMLLVSHVPDVLWREVIGGTGWLYWPKVGLLAAVTVASLLWTPLRPLRPFALILIVIFVASELFAGLSRTPFWQRWFGGDGAPFNTAMLSIQVQRMAVTLIAIAALLMMGYRRQECYLTIGQLDAPAAPIRLFGMRSAEPWTRFGRNFAIFISLGTLAFLFMSMRPAPATLLGVLPALPAVLLLAAMNAFSEEVSYRAALLGTLNGPLTPGQAVWLSAVFFGIGHYYGVPYGPVGVVMATFLGWLLGKAMVETKGLFWPWFIHFLQDVWIFSFMALGPVGSGS
ncbi:MAG: CPBP family intramembrane glutamic endopeptidase [Anaerolineae bacterium]|nr:CPBP family intramembrane metalloprotease [Candidatus Roseilinea sp.]MDW8449987.1 CPBP family intramembrane glutamic endopeptidase [Anaerolineae bacterium]